MKHFAELLDRLSYEPRRNAKIRLMVDHFAATGDPERGLALAALTGGLDFRHAKPALIRGLAAERVDPVLFALSYDYVGDLSETVALVWPARPSADRQPSLDEVVAGLESAGKAALPGLVASWLDALDETGRWALLKLITGSLRVGVSARLAKTALAELGHAGLREIEEVWHGLSPPYESLFAWIEGRAEAPHSVDPAPFRSPMLSHAVEEADLARLDPADFSAEWKWDGIRVQAVGAVDAEGRRIARLYSRTGEDIGAAFPDILDAIDFDGALDGELLVVSATRVRPFGDLQQRLNRKSVTAKLMAAFPAHIRAYDLLCGKGDDLRGRPFSERRARLEDFVETLDSRRFSLSAFVPFETWEDVAAARADPAGWGAGSDASAVEGLMLKQRASLYVPGRPKGPWWKWKRDPHSVDAVLMYAQRGHGKRSSFYSDYTFGIWRQGEDGDELVPVGKAYFGFTDEELRKIDRFVRRNTVNRFGPVREVVHEAGEGLVLEIAFEGLNRSTRHKSGIAMRFPRVARLRWDKAPRDADRLEALEALLPS